MYSFSLIIPGQLHQTERLHRDIARPELASPGTAGQTTADETPGGKIYIYILNSNINQRLAY